jgi:2-desacetyl-2-hydroxyethyl bacteriochlorophyllide A dehydrogenase
MRALVYLGPRRMELQELADPEPGAGEVVIRTRVAAICGSDLHGFREASPRRVPPLVMGHEAVGTVDAVGPGVDAGRVGERVVLKPILGCGACPSCHAGASNRCRDGRLVGRDLAGGFAERFAVPTAAAVPVPGGIADADAVMVEPLANALHVARAAVGAGDVVSVIGSGPIGSLVVRAAFLRGAARVFATDPVASRRRLAQAQGAEPLDGDDPVAAILAATAGEGADVVVDAAGFEVTWGLALRSVRPGGRIVEVGLGASSGALAYAQVLAKEAMIQGSYGWTEGDFAEALDALAEGRVDLHGWVTRAPVAQGQRAFEELVDGDGDRFKVVLGFDDAAERSAVNGGAG